MNNKIFQKGFPEWFLVRGYPNMDTVIKPSRLVVIKCAIKDPLNGLRVCSCLNTMLLHASDTLTTQNTCVFDYMLLSDH